MLMLCDAMNEPCDGKVTTHVVKLLIAIVCCYYKESAPAPFF